ncbi:MAG TPA: hypothetical protein ENI95_01435, partial [Chloroflexi bacterium]|nr:hypothetical protein [Chloroflexota bacterium]
MTIRVRLASIPVLLVLVAGTLAMTSCGSGASEQPAATGGEAAAPVGDTGPSGQQPAELENTISGLATVEEVEVQVVEEGVQIRVQVVARGTLPDGCTTISGSTVNRDGRTFTITINTTRPVDAACTEAVTPFEEIIPLEVGGLPAGIYTLTVNGLSTSFRLSEEAGRAAPTPAATPPPGIPASCVSLAADRVTYVNREGGYCFLYPIELRLEEMAPDRVSFSGAVEAPGIAPVPVRLEVQVGESVGGQPLEALVSTEIGDAEVTRTPATIGGSPAEVVEGLPGNPGARRAYILYNDRLYTVALSPLGDFPQAGDEAFSAEEVLVWEVAWDTVWQVVVNSFAFLTEGAGELYAA